MVYLEWDEFYRQSEALYRANPLQTRYCTKYVHKDGVLVLKVTDDIARMMSFSDVKIRQIFKCLKFKTDQATDLKKLEKLNALFFALMGKGLAQGSADELMAEATPQQPARAPAKTPPPQQQQSGKGGKKSGGRRD